MQHINNNLTVCYYCCEVKLPAYKAGHHSNNLTEKPPKSPGGGLISAVFEYFSPPTGGWGSVF